MTLFYFITISALALVRATPQYFYLDQPELFHYTSQSFAPHPYSTFHVNPNYHFRTVASHPFAAPLLPENNVQYRGISYQSRSDNGATIHQSIFAAPQPENVDYRGFAYQTRGGNEVTVHKTILPSAEPNNMVQYQISASRSGSEVEPHNRPILTNPGMDNDVEYRGFAYQTRSESGATSHVLFVSGPQSQQIHSRMFTKPRMSQFNPAKNIASDMVDSTENVETLSKKVQDAPTTEATYESYNIFDQFGNYDNAGSRLVNFYSRNSELIADSSPEFGLQIAPLSINPRFSKRNNSENINNSEIAAESIITNTRLNINELNHQNQKMDLISHFKSNLFTTPVHMPETSTEMLFKTADAFLSPRFGNFQATSDKTNDEQNNSNNNAITTEKHNLMLLETETTTETTTANEITTDSNTTEFSKSIKSDDLTTYTSKYDEITTVETTDIKISATETEEQTTEENMKTTTESLVI